MSSDIPMGSRFKDARARAERELAARGVEIPDIHSSEAFSFWTHCLGAVAALFGLIFLILRAEGALAVTAVSIYGGSLVFLLTSSSLHHAIHPKSQAGSLALRRMDHVAIYLLIAGSYTPICLIGVPPMWGIPILVLVWVFGIVGILLKVFRPFSPRWVTVAMYLIMGWLAIIGAKPIYDVFAGNGLWLLAAGGVVYSVGAVVYARKRPDPWTNVVGFHGLWHIFVLVAAGFHYVFVYEHVLAG